MSFFDVGRGCDGLSRARTSDACVVYVSVLRPSKKCVSLSSFDRRIIDFSSSQMYVSELFDLLRLREVARPWARVGLYL